MNTVKTAVSFSSAGTTCRAWYYLPESPQSGTCIVMGPGFGGVRAGGLSRFAETLAATGWPVLVFDYRTFGDSEGEPRQWLSIPRQIADWQAAIAKARTLPETNPGRIILFGISFSGGHVIEVAARDPRIAAVLSVSPMLDGWQASRTLARFAGMGQALRLAGAGLIDVCKSMLGRTSLRLPVVGPPGRLAFMTTPDAEPGVRAIMPEDWRNEVCARIALPFLVYRPVRKVHRLSCPVLFQACAKDTVAPHKVVDAVAQGAGDRVVAHRYAAGHFDIYESPWLDKLVADQCAFLEQVFAQNN